MTNRIAISTQKPYEVIIQRGALSVAGKLALEVHESCTVALITDDIVGKLYAPTVTDAFEQAGFTVCTFTFANGESSKNMQTYERAIEFLAEQALTRGDLVVALGGGVVGDLAGFCAASYLRGIDFIQIPTTFLASIDSSVGGKTGINLSVGKNLCGAFHQPRMVIVDTDTFSTLAPERFADGAAEAIKYGVLSGKTLFDRLRHGIDSADIEGIIASCVQIKCDYVTQDEFEQGKRKYLNLGHTFGHAIERCSGYTITHGHAVGIGMVMAAQAGDILGLGKANCKPALIEALTSNQLPVKTDFAAEALTAAMMHDKKRSGESIDLIIPLEIGHCIRYEMPVAELGALVANVQEAN